MFRRIARLGPLLTFEHNAWRTNYTTVYVPVSLVTLKLDKHGVVVSSMDNVWMSHHDTHEEAKKEFHKFLACIHPSPDQRTDMPSPDALAMLALK